MYLIVKKGLGGSPSGVEIEVDTFCPNKPFLDLEGRKGTEEGEG